MRKIFILTFLILMLSMCSSAWAKSGLVFELYIDHESKLVSADIALEDDIGGTAVTGLIVNEDGDVVYVAQGFTNEDGEFNFSFINKDANGSYTITIAAPRKGLVETSSFKMVTDGIKEDIFNTNKDTDGMKKIIESYGSNMNLDMEAFDLLSDKEAVYSFMADDDMIDLSSLETITNGFYGAVIIRTLAENKDGEEYLSFLGNDIYSILNKDKVPMGKKESLFDELDKDIKEGVLEKVVENKYESAEELSDALAFYVLEQSIENAVQWTEINPIMQKYADAGLLNVDFSAYNKLKKPQNADSELIGESFEDYKEIEDAFNAAVKKASKSTSSGGSSGGGGGGGSGTVISSVKVPEPVEKPIEGVKNIFTDMADYMWANEAVTYLAEKGIINGVGDDKFAPEKGLTREEVSTIIVKTQKLSIEGKTSNFNDVPAGHWSYPYVSAMLESGLMVGISEDMFGATAQITRNEFAVIMKRLIDLYDAELTLNTSVKEYDDAANIPDWAKENVMFLKSAGLMLGNTGNCFDGGEIVSRAYACDILYTILNAVNYDAEVK